MVEYVSFQHWSLGNGGVMYYAVIENNKGYAFMYDINGRTIAISIDAFYDHIFTLKNDNIREIQEISNVEAIIALLDSQRINRHATNSTELAERIFNYLQEFFTDVPQMQANYKPLNFETEFYFEFDIPAAEWEDLHHNAIFNQRSDMTVQLEYDDPKVLKLRLCYRF